MAALRARDGKIYDLAAFRRMRAQRRDVEAKPAPAPSSGGVWYHEAAIRSEDPARRS